jgi:hypothetical protein
MTKPRSKLVALLFDAWADLDKVIEGLTADVAFDSLDGGSSFAWTVAHVANVLDATTNVRFRKVAPHPYIGKDEFWFGGTGAADDWDAVRTGAREVQKSTRAYLSGLDDSDLDRAVPYDGSLPHLIGKNISLQYSIFRSIAHHYFHIGEIASKRDRLGHSVGDYPGRLDESR